MPNPVFCLMGPTASGKTHLAIELVTLFPMEIISVDSAMIYRGMDIGTAKPSLDELDLAPHHLIDILDPPESFSAASFCEAVTPLIKRIMQAGKIPLLVGGTMMYFQALQQGLSTLPEADAALRQQLLEKAKEDGWPSLHDELKKVDPVAAQRIHANDTQRIQRALEVFYVTGKPMSWFLNNPKKPGDFKFINLMLFPEERAWLHQRIALRFKDMLKQGFLDEVEGLLQKWPLTSQHPSMRSVGYRQALDYLAGLDNLDCFCEKGIAATRQLAKRQLTWLRHWPQGQYYACDKVSAEKELIVNVREILDNPQKQ